MPRKKKDHQHEFMKVNKMDKQTKKDLIEKLQQPAAYRDGTVTDPFTGDMVPYLTPVNFAILCDDLNETKAVLIAILES